MSTEKKVIALADRAAKAVAALEATASSEDQIATELIDRHQHHYRYEPTSHTWLAWDEKRWQEERTGQIYDRIRKQIREAVGGTAGERRTATASVVAGVERLARCDQRIVVLPEQLDAEPWLLNTQSGIVDMRTGAIRSHDPSALMTRITAARVDRNDGRDLWSSFLSGITQGDRALEEYLQRVFGYCATGDTSEDALFYFYGIGGNGKSTLTEAVEAALGNYAMVFPADVLMESKGERHPTELAQFKGVRFAVSSEPSSSAVWNDARIKSVTGDATISARVMRGDFFTFPRTHKTLIVGNHMPRLNAVTHAIRRRVQMVPFRAVFEQSAGQPGMRERLKSEALGAVLAWVVEGAAMWRAQGTMPPPVVRKLTEDYLTDQDDFNEWLDECCERRQDAAEASAALYRAYVSWCDRNGSRAKSNKALSMSLVEAGFEKRHTMGGRMFAGLKLREA